MFSLHNIIIKYCIKKSICQKKVQCTNLWYWSVVFGLKHYIRIIKMLGKVSLLTCDIKVKGPVSSINRFCIVQRNPCILPKVCLSVKIKWL